MNKTGRVLTVLAGIALILPGLCTFGFGIQYPSGEFGGPGMVVTGVVLVVAGLFLVTLGRWRRPK